MDWLAVHPSGTMAVLEGGPAAVHLFDSSGVLLRTIPNGQGPVEVGRPSGLGFTADTLWVFDPGNGRILLHPLDGGRTSSVPLRPLPVPGASFSAVPTALLADGTLQALSRPSLQEMVDSDTAFVRWHRFDREGRHLGELARANMAGLMVRFDLPPPVSAARYLRRPFTGGASIAFPPVDTSLVQVDGAGATLVVERRGYGGTSIFRDTLRLRARPVTPADRDSATAAVAARLAGTGGDPGPILPIVREAVEWPTVRHPLRGLTVGPDGTIWLDVEEETGRALLRLDEEGRITGRLLPPDAFLPMQASGDRLWGVVSPELGEPAVVRMAVRD